MFAPIADMILVMYENYMPICMLSFMGVLLGPTSTAVVAGLEWGLSRVYDQQIAICQYDWDTDNKASNLFNSCSKIADSGFKCPSYC